MDISEVLAYAPHRAPMVWVDEVISFSDNAQGGECLIKIKSEGHYMGPKGLRASSCVEFIAQSYGSRFLTFAMSDPLPHLRAKSFSTAKSFAQAS